MYVYACNCAFCVQVRVQVGVCESWFLCVQMRACVFEWVRVCVRICTCVRLILFRMVSQMLHQKGMHKQSRDQH